MKDKILERDAEVGSEKSIPVKGIENKTLKFIKPQLNLGTEKL